MLLRRLFQIPYTLRLIITNYRLTTKHKINYNTKPNQNKKLKLLDILFTFHCQKNKCEIVTVTYHFIIGLNLKGCFNKKRRIFNHFIISSLSKQNKTSKNNRNLLSKLISKSQSILSSGC